MGLHLVGSDFDSLCCRDYDLIVASIYCHNVIISYIAEPSLVWMDTVVHSKEK